MLSGNRRSRPILAAAWSALSLMAGAGWVFVIACPHKAGKAMLTRTLRGNPFAHCHRAEGRPWRFSALPTCGNGQAVIGVDLDARRARIDRPDGFVRKRDRLAADMDGAVSRETIPIRRRRKNERNARVPHDPAILAPE